jgi:hypothetical protein
MRRQICRVIIALGCLAGLSGPAMASTFSCPPGSFLSILDGANFSTPTGPYGEVCVTLTDSTHAFIQAETLSPFVMFGAGMLGLQVNSTGFAIVGGDAGIIGGTSASASIAFPGSTEDGFGKFDLSITNFDGPGSGTAYLTFSLQNTAGTWANVSSVLAANASGYDAAMQIASCDDGCTGLGFVSEHFTNGAVVPQPPPEPAMLGLLGIGLLAMGWPPLRRRMA